jgi:hypothetical protein
MQCEGCQRKMTKYEHFLGKEDLKMALYFEFERGYK